MHRPSTQEAISGDWSRRARRGVPSGRTVFIKLESYSFAVPGDRSPFSCGLRMSSAATPPPLASRALNRGPDRSSSVAAGRQAVVKVDERSIVKSVGEKDSAGKDQERGAEVHRQLTLAAWTSL